MTAHSAIIDSGYCGGEGDGTNLMWEFSDDGTLAISGEGEMADMSNSYYGSYDILRVEISEGVTSIGNYAFYNCSSLANIEIPGSVTSIGDFAFSSCSSLSSINVSKNNEIYSSIDGVVFSKDKKELIIYPAGKGNVYEIPEGITSIGNNAFWGCSSLESIVIPESVTSIGDWAFCDCSSLTSIVIPKSVTSIGDYAFAECASLESIVIPESVTSIGNFAFQYCSSLTSIEIPSSVTSIGEGAFYNCSSLSSINVSENNEIYSSIDGVLFSKDKKELVSYPAGKGNVYEIPESVTSIGEEAFCYCSSLEYIISNNPTPPSCIGLSCFSYVDPNIPIYVPAESIDLYRNAEGWDYFTNFLPLEELGGDEPDGSAVEETEAVGIALKITARDGRIYCEEEFRIVNLAGQDVTAMNGELQGTYIVVSGDKAVKVVVD